MNDKIKDLRGEKITEKLSKIVKPGRKFQTWLFINYEGYVVFLGGYPETAISWYAIYYYSFNIYDVSMQDYNEMLEEIKKAYLLGEGYHSRLDIEKQQCKGFHTKATENTFDTSYEDFIKWHKDLRATDKGFFANDPEVRERRIKEYADGIYYLRQQQMLREMK